MAGSVHQDRVRRRRLIACLSVGVLVLCVAGLLLVVLPTTRHVKVVRVLKTDQVGPQITSTPSLPAASAGVQPGRKPVYEEEPGAPSAPAAAAGSASGTAHSALPSGATASFARLSATLPGRIELAVDPLGAGPREVLGNDEAAHGWSTTKVPVLVALLRARGSVGLTSQEQAWAQSAITESNNESVLALFGDLERLKGGLGGASRYMEGFLRMSGDNETVIATAPPPAGAVTTFGQTEWAPGEAVKFFRALALSCLLPADQTGYVLGLMQNIEPSESWGLGSAGFHSVAFKGGWGPEPSGAYLVRQSGIIDVGSSRGVAVSIVAFPSSGSFSSGTQMLTQAAVWLHHELRLVPRAATGCSAE